MFIDKPIACDEDEAVKFMKELKAAGCRITGGSMCVYAPLVEELIEIAKNQTHGKIFGGYLRAPVNMNNAYGNFFFYSQHLAEVTQKIFGYYPKSVRSNINGTVNTVTVKYDDYNVNMAYCDGNGLYYASVSAEKEIVGGRYPINTTVLAVKEFDAFYSLLKGNEQTISYKEFIAPVFLLTAIDRSIRSGEEEKVNEIEDI